MKQIILTAIIFFFCFTKGTAQVNNLSDLLNISELSVEGMIKYYQYVWEIKTPIQDTSHKGYITEKYPFIYNREGKKQILKKCGRKELSTGRTLWLTNFISSDIELLKRITKNLVFEGFELKRTLKSNSLYEDGNRTVTIQTQSDEDMKLPKGCYSINVIVN